MTAWSILRRALAVLGLALDAKDSDMMKRARALVASLTKAAGADGKAPDSAKVLADLEQAEAVLKDRAEARRVRVRARFPKK